MEKVQYYFAPGGPSTGLHFFRDKLNEKVKGNVTKSCFCNHKWFRGSSRPTI